MSQSPTKTATSPAPSPLGSDPADAYEIEDIMEPDNFVPAPSKPKPWDRSPESLATEQIARAVQDTTIDPSQYPDWPWTNLNDLIGPFLPGDLFVLAARSGQGKTTITLNLLDYWGDTGWDVLVFGLEQSPEQFRRKRAAHRLGLHPASVMRNRWDRLPPGSQHRVQEEIKRQVLEVGVHLCPARNLDRETLRRWFEWGVRQGVTLVVLDHINRMDHGGAQGATAASIAETVKSLKELGMEYGVATLCNAQVNRWTSDLLAPYLPPPLTALKGSGALEEEADAVIMAHRVLKPGVTRKEMDAVVKGLVAPSTIAQENVMRLRCGKHRLDGDMADRWADLIVEDGVLKEPMEFE